MWADLEMGPDAMRCTPDDTAPEYLTRAMIYDAELDRALARIERQARHLSRGYC